MCSALFALVAGACQPAQPSTTPAVATPVSSAEPTSPVELLVSNPDDTTNTQHSRRYDVVLTVLHVQIPRAAKDRVAPLWNHLREDVLDASTQRRLHENGLRVGVGHAHWWDAVKAALDAVDGLRTVVLNPVRIPSGYPLALELDAKPREQTLFFMADDGVLTGETWPASRNVLRVSYELDLEDPARIQLALVPEVRQRLDGWRWVRNEAGFTQLPKYSGRAFSTASLLVPITNGDFLMLAPGERADVAGMVGQAFLVQELDGTAYDSYVFLRPDMTYVAFRD